MKVWYFAIVYFFLTAVGFVGASGRIAGIKLILCGPAASLSNLCSAISRLSDPEFAVSWRVPDLYKTIALHGAIWLVGIGLFFLFRAVGWKPWIAVAIAWSVAVPINLFYEMAQNV